MPPRLCVSGQRQIATKRIALLYECLGFSFLAILWFGLLPRIQAADNILPNQPVSAPPTKTQLDLVTSYGKLPLSFEANQGQVSGPAKFLARGIGYTLLLDGQEMVLELEKSTAGTSPKPGAKKQAAGGNAEPKVNDPGPEAAASVLRMELLGASAGVEVAGADQLPGKTNYFIGNNPAEWRTNVPNYAKVRYQKVYPGVDLVYYGTQGGQLEYDFVVAPGADPHAIRLSFQGATHLRVDKATGDLVLTLDGSELRFHKPVAYQDKPTVDNQQSPIGNRKSLDGRFVLTGKNQVGFQVAAYDRRAPLIIDPSLDYSTYLGGGKYTIGYRVAVDASGSAYVAGATNSSDFPTTAGVFSSMLNPGACPLNHHTKIFTCPDVFVTKLDPTGTQIVYSTYLGGSAPDGATGISVDSSGNAYVTGATGSRDFPVTAGAFQTSAIDSSWRTHAFATKLNPTGSALIYSTYLAGTHDDFSMTSAIDSNGNLYVAGGTTSKDFPTTAGAFQTVISGTGCVFYEQQWPCADGFIAKLNSSGTALVYSTYLGGSNLDAILGLAVDSAGSAYVTGATRSTDFPTANALQPSFGPATCGAGQPPQPCVHGFVTKLNSTGTALDYSTYLAGNEYDAGLGIAVDTNGAAYVTGATFSTQFPTTSGAAQTTFGGGSCGGTANPFICPDAFVAKLNSTGSSLAYSTYLGGSSFDYGMAITVDNAGNAYVVGGTSSVDFPTDASTGNFQGGTCSTAGAMFILQTRQPGWTFNCPNAFLTEIDPTGSKLTFSTYLGGDSGDVAFSVAVDASGGTYVAGSTLSPNFPITAGAFQTTMTGYVDAFISKFSPPLAATPAFSILSGNYTSVQSVTISDATTGAKIYYTTDGTTPTTASTPYTGAIAVGMSTTIEAIATASGYSNSLVATATYTITLSSQSPAATPTFSVPSGTYTTAQTVTISDATTGAAIYYTTNGTTPTTASLRYSGAIAVNSTETIEAIAVASGYNNSAVATATYTIGSTPTFATLVNFDGTNGANPDLMSLVQGTDGNFYGTTYVGGANGGGTVFNITPGGTLTTLHSFLGPDDGLYPNAGLVQATNGNFYGTTFVSGPNPNRGGTVFEITAGGTLTTLHGFAGYPTEGAYPRDALVQATDGNFYGTTVGGGANDNCNGSPGDCGTVFKITAGGTLTTLYSFADTGGFYPLAGLVQGTDGNFYGTTTGDGYAGTSTVFKITAGGALTTLYTFCSQINCADGELPTGVLVLGADGNFYGTASQGGIGYGGSSGNCAPFGCGTVFKITPGGTLTTLHSFAGYPTEGASPSAGLIQPPDGNLYGTTSNGGANNVPACNSGELPAGCGTVFKISPGGTLTTLYSFCSQTSCADGDDPIGGLVQATNGTFYGTTYHGGTSSDGTVFSLSVGLGPFVETEPTSGMVGAAVIIIGTNLTGATSVTFNGTAATFTVVSSSEITATVPTGATTGTVQVTTPSGTLNSNVPYTVPGTAQPAATPTFSVPGGTYTSAQTVTISDTTPGATIYYAINAPPTAASTQYTGAITVNSTETIEAIAIASGYSTSAVATATYTITMPIASIAPTGLTFGAQLMDTRSTPKTVTLTNVGITPLSISSLTVVSISPLAPITGKQAGDFAIESGSCVAGGIVPVSGSCTINLVFKPTAAGVRFATLVIGDNAPTSPQTVNLRGMGTAVRLSATSLGFAPQPVDTTSAPKTVTLTNLGNTPLRIANFTLGGADAGDFAIQSNSTCGGGRTVASEGSCTINVGFKPTAAGARSATLVIDDSDPSSPQTVSLSGTGVGTSRAPLGSGAEPEVTTSPQRPPR